MKSVLISIQPKWVEKICHEIGKENGKPIYEKVIEVRKTRPKLETPFKCYIYATWNGSKKEILVKQDGLLFCEDWRKASGLQRASGKVIGEFVCDKIICSQAYFDSQGKNHLTNIFEEDIKRTCLTGYELWNYIAGKSVKANEMHDGYLWHISDLKIYDKPKELSEFKKPCDRFLDCITCKRLVRNDFLSCDNIIKRPPQSWCYVEIGE